MKTTKYKSSKLIELFQAASTPTANIKSINGSNSSRKRSSRSIIQRLAYPRKICLEHYFEAMFGTVAATKSRLWILDSIWWMDVGDLQKTFRITSLRVEGESRSRGNNACAPGCPHEKPAPRCFSRTRNLYIVPSLNLSQRRSLLVESARIPPVYTSRLGGLLVKLGPKNVPSRSRAWLVSSLVAATNQLHLAENYLWLARVERWSVLDVFQRRIENW